MYENVTGPAPETVMAAWPRVSVKVAEFELLLTEI